MFAELMSPKWLFLRSHQIEHAKQMINACRNGTLVPGHLTDSELWTLRQVYEATVHPQTGETVPTLFRLSAFVPVNIPICAGMLLASPTLGNTIFWQWINQSYNAGFNFANRNASSEQDNMTILSKKFIQ
ncbi:hypothetical protein PsorP6_008031 [Peronosclerospora sorghi]|uniref:Uncharacterized protein n=1 Tax=Peronosclerospora sorghi TaxID=230839 RepID=A0ACC0W9P8_9STRA|nr:hypothetical protein PsorP6_008031 [Peronosclerospora sorghi]